MPPLKKPAQNRSQRRKNWRVHAAGLALSLATGFAGGKIVHQNETLHQTSRVRATVERIAEGEAAKSREKINELPWTVLTEAKQQKPSTEGAAFDRVVEKLLAERKLQNAEDLRMGREEGQFGEHVTERFIDALVNLPDAEVKSRLEMLYSEKYPDHVQSRAGAMKMVQHARGELDKYFSERVQRAMAASRVATSEYEKRALAMVAKNARSSAVKVGSFTGLSALLAYYILLGGLRAARNRRKK